MGVFDSILGFLNPEVISTYNDLVNNHSEAFRRWRGKLCSDTADTLVVDKRMRSAELLRSLNDFIGSAFSPRIDMTGGKLLTVTDSPAGLDNINHIIA